MSAFDLILADPPWQYAHSRSRSRRVERHYPTMTVDDIAALNVGALAHDGSVLLLWATAPKLPEAMRVMDAWGFAYVSSAIWDKRVIGTGYWWRGQHELLLVGRRKKSKPPAPHLRISSVIQERRRAHSQKPDAVYVWAEAAWPEARRVELFARTRRPGWSAWGDEVCADVAMPA
jgi:N6-adenosine-specific RNA methylase IME4